MKAMEILHTPVLVNEVLEKLNLKKGDTVVDCTVGEGGHSVEILKVIGPSGFLYGIDQDSEALKIAHKRLKNVGDNFFLVNDNFLNIKAIQKKYNIPAVNGILADLGISSLQLYYNRRGFSFIKNGPLDMRMSFHTELTAADVVNSFPENELADIIFKFGEEKLSRHIAKAIVDYRRRKKKIETTEELADIVANVYHRKRGKIHPATRTFQALRIFVNNEMGSLEMFLKDAPDILAQDARIAVISYHSLEDRVVKKAFREDKRLNRINKKVIRPLEEELLSNRRSRSAKLRVAERI